MRSTRAAVAPAAWRRTPRHSAATVTWPGAGSSEGADGRVQQDRVQFEGGRLLAEFLGEFDLVGDGPGGRCAGCGFRPERSPASSSHGPSAWRANTVTGRSPSPSAAPTATWRWTVLSAGTVRVR
ncbi:hypothetical protein ACFQ3Z_43480 [Streptomyces nogalater]